MTTGWTYDFIIVGGGLTGSVIASRLAEKQPAAQILLIEAGPDVSNHPLTSAPLACFGLHGSELDWNYTTVPQKHLHNRECYNAAAKALGGGTAINYGMWTRGNAADLDRWAEAVGDRAWSYEGLLPYFVRSETHSDPNVDPKKHGRAGPIYNVSVSASGVNRKYPLGEAIRTAWERVGMHHIPDANGGNPMGIGELTENWRDGKRQIASEVYRLSEKQNVVVLANTMVSRVLIENREGKNVATGVQVVDGSRRYMATREVILTAGVYRTPQILMLSGVGPAKELNRHGIRQLFDSPEVGLNFHDHFAVVQWWKLRQPEKGLAIGTPLWTDPDYSKGLPVNWVITTGVPREVLVQALQVDGEDVEGNPILAPDVCHLEMFVCYAPAGAHIANVHVPVDGTHIATPVLGLAPTSSGSIKLASADPTAAPLIDPNYYATEVDRAELRWGLRLIAKLMHDTPEGRAIVDSETTGPEFAPIRPDSSDEEIDERIRCSGNTFYHPAGSAAMGKVIDSKLQVYGVEGLRVADASILPVTVASHYQAVLYAIAEKAADLIAG